MMSFLSMALPMGFTVHGSGLMLCVVLVFLRVKVRAVDTVLVGVRRMTRIRRRNMNLQFQPEWGKRRRKQRDQMLPANSPW